MASAMIERAELPVQRKSTLNGRFGTTASRATGGRGDRSGCGLRYAVGLGMRHAGLALAGAIAIVGVFAGRVESLPRDPRWIIDPRFFRLGVTAGRFTLLDDRAASLAQSGVNFMQFRLVLDLNAEVIEARLATACRDRK